MPRTLVILFLASALAAASVGVTSASARTTYLEIFRMADGSDGVVRSYKKPRGFTVILADSTIRYSGLRWTRWGSRRAVARGRARVCTADIGCSSSRVRLVASHRQHCYRFNKYARLTTEGGATSGNGPSTLLTVNQCND